MAPGKHCPFDPAPLLWIRESGRSKPFRTNVFFIGAAPHARAEVFGLAVMRTTSMKLLLRFADDESGATAIEYGLIAALIAVVCITAMGTLGTRLNSKFNRIAANLT